MRVCEREREGEKERERERERRRNVGSVLIEGSGELWRNVHVPL